MLECIRHRAKSTEETNAKLYGGQNNRQTDKNQKETPKMEKEIRRQNILIAVVKSTAGICVRLVA